MSIDEILTAAAEDMAVKRDAWLRSQAELRGVTPKRLAETHSVAYEVEKLEHLGENKWQFTQRMWLEPKGQWPGSGRWMKLDGGA